MNCRRIMTLEEHKAAHAAMGPGDGSGVWGSITGLITDQTDLLNLNWGHIAVAHSVAGPVALDMTYVSNVDVMLTANITSLTMASVPVSATKVFYMMFEQDITGGRTVAFSSQFKGVTSGLSLGNYDKTLYAFALRADGNAYMIARNVFPFGGDVYWNNVSLLMHFDGANDSTVFTDTSPVANTLTAAGTAKISTAQSKWGGSSAIMGASGRVPLVGSNSPFHFGADPFTIEAYIYPTSAVVGTICNLWTTGKLSWSFYMTASRQLAFGASANGTAATYPTTGVAVTLNTWQRVAVVREAGVSSNLKFYVNDSLVYTSTLTTNLFPLTTTQFTVGADSAGASTWFQGYIDELRITKGIARTLTPLPTGPYPDYGL